MTDAGHLYAIEFTSGVIKVGRGANPTKRIAVHAANAAIHGGELRNWFTSRRHRGSTATERHLIEACAANGRLVFGREYFRDLTFEKVCELIESVVAAHRQPTPGSTKHTA